MLPRRWYFALIDHLSRRGYTVSVDCQIRTPDPQTPIQCPEKQVMIVALLSLAILYQLSLGIRLTVGRIQSGWMYLQSLLMRVRTAQTWQSYGNCRVASALDTDAEPGVA